MRLAYATVGDGPPLVKVANWLTHLDYDWESPVWRHWWRDLSARHRLVRYDERGCGLSDWDVDDFSLETWVADLETVVDAAGLERFPLLGISQGGPVAMTYAARHPERVSGLILYGTYSQGRLARARTQQAEDEARLLVQLVRLGWGHDSPPSARCSRCSSCRRHARAVGGVRRAPADDDVAEQRGAVHGGVPEAWTSSTSPATVSVPTLVLHARRDARIPVEEARRLAALIPGSRFVTLESPNHLLLGDEPAWPRFINEVEAFLAELA